jgi:TPR repeat protein
MAPADTASLPCGHMYHCECVKQLRKHGVDDACPVCRKKLPPGPEQRFVEAVRLMVRADRVRQSSDEQARPLYAQAAALLEQVLQEEPGHLVAQSCLGYCCYENGEHGKAVQWQRKAAAQGGAQAQYALGVCNHRGEGVRKDTGKAVEWFRNT